MLLDRTAHRVAQASIDGHPLDPAARYVMCTNTYRAGGAGNFAGTNPADIVFGDERVMQDILRQFLGHPRAVPHPNRGSLRFKAMPGTSVVFETGPAAYQYLEEIADLAPEPRGLTRSGFLRLKLDLSNGA